MNCCSLWSLCHSVSPILYIVLIYLNIDTVWSHHRNIFFFYICTFCISFLSIGFECILTILWDSVRILSLRCVYWSQYVCRQERKRLYEVSILSFWFNSHVMYFCFQWWINFHSLHWIATVSFHSFTHQYSRHFILTIKTSLSPKINFYAK